MSSPIPTSEVVTVERRDAIAVVWLDRPDRLNAFGPEFWLDFPAIVDALGADDGVRAVVIAAKGRAFSAGLDLVATAPAMATGDLTGSAASPASPVAHRRATYRMIKTMQRTFTALAECPKPVIAAVHGYCIGAGIDLITACDVRYAAADAVFSVRETRMAMVADVGTLQRLPLIVDPGSLAEIVYTGRDFDADEALAMHLVTRVEPDAAATLEAALATADRIAANSPLAVQGAKAVLAAALRSRIAEHLDYVALWNAAFLHSDDLAEAMAAFTQKREPRFEGH